MVIELDPLEKVTHSARAGIEWLGKSPCVAMTTMYTTPGGVTFYI